MHKGSTVRLNLKNAGYHGWHGGSSQCVEQREQKTI